MLAVLLSLPVVTRSQVIEQPQFLVQDIRVEGLQRISAGTVFTYLPVEVGDTLTEDRYSEIVRTLFQTGFFTDVKLLREGDVLVIQVTERPSIAEIEIEGNQDISDDDLREALKQVGLAEGRVFDRSLLDRTEQELREQYFARGKYGMRIESDVSELPRNTVSVKLSISEGQVARIKQVKIIGNEDFSQRTLLKEFRLTTPNWLTWLSKRDRYSKPQLTADLEALRTFYLDRGYIQFEVNSTQVSITPDRKDIYITINITEGEQFRVSNVAVAGDLPVPVEDLEALLAIEPDSVFSRADVTTSTQRIGDRLGDSGYAFANINTVPEIDEENNTVALTLFVDPGRRVYVRRINMIGNTRTYDEVMRREMRQMESSWFSTTKVDRSRARLERLGYFEEVNVETPQVPGSPDQVDVNYAVTERASGNLSIGAGFSQASGIILSAGISQENFLGTGRSVDVSVNASKVNRVLSFGYVNPYYTIDGVSRGFNVFFRQTDANNANLADYVLDRIGGNVSFGIPLTEFNFINFTLGPEYTKVNTTSNTSDTVKDILDDQGSKKFTNLEGTVSWSHDTRNRAFFTDRGMLNRISGEVTTPGSDWTYYKVGFRHGSFYPLFGGSVLGLTGDIGYGDGFGDDTDIPFYENYFAGGVRSVRGFKTNTLGPRDSDDDPEGGSFKTVANASGFCQASVAGGCWQHSP